ncbi:hypothetical protein Scep_009304 [Stephania cephalantha]|uniref:Uncharacterized protein n=1 Tax=Stephania cephalantha TaxID=152367 RepID=A0AAP0JUB8_9MAGN
MGGSRIASTVPSGPSGRQPGRYKRSTFILGTRTRPKDPGPRPRFHLDRPKDHPGNPAPPRFEPTPSRDNERRLHGLAYLPLECASSSWGSEGRKFNFLRGLSDGRFGGSSVAQYKGAPCNDPTTPGPQCQSKLSERPWDLVDIPPLRLERAPLEAHKSVRARSTAVYHWATMARWYTAVERAYLCLPPGARVRAVGRGYPRGPMGRFWIASIGLRSWRL